MITELRVFTNAGHTALHIRYGSGRAAFRRLDPAQTLALARRITYLLIRGAHITTRPFFGQEPGYVVERPKH